jgi:hypothetical protein
MGVVDGAIKGENTRSHLGRQNQITSPPTYGPSTCNWTNRRVREKNEILRAREMEICMCVYIYTYIYMPI